MYLLLNNNKYLHQIVESLYFCLKQNNIKCKIVFNIDDIYDHNIQNDIKVNVSNIKDNSDLLSKKQTYGNIYIIFNINSIDALPKNYIIYNFEQLITEREW